MDRTQAAAGRAVEAGHRLQRAEREGVGGVRVEDPGVGGGRGGRRRRRRRGDPARPTRGERLAVRTAIGTTVTLGISGVAVGTLDPSVNGDRPRPWERATTEKQTTTRDGWRLIVAQMRAQWRGLPLGVAVGLLWTAGKVPVPKLVQLAIDNGIEVGDLGVIVRWALLIASPARARRCSPGCAATARSARPAGPRRSCATGMFAHLQRLHFAFHDQAQTGQLMSRANTDLQQIQNFVVMIPLTISNLGHGRRRHGHPAAHQPVAGAPRPRHAAVRQRARQALLHAAAPAMVGIQQESAELATVVEETVIGRPGGQGLRRRGGAGASGCATRPTTSTTCRCESARIRARYWPALDLLPNLGLVARARLRRPPGARRRPRARRAGRVQRLRRRC